MLPSRARSGSGLLMAWRGQPPSSALLSRVGLGWDSGARGCCGFLFPQQEVLVESSRAFRGWYVIELVWSLPALQLRADSRPGEPTSLRSCLCSSGIRCSDFWVSWACPRTSFQALGDPFVKWEQWEQCLLPRAVERIKPNKVWEVLHLVLVHSQCLVGISCPNSSPFRAVAPLHTLDITMLAVELCLWCWLPFHQGMP